MKVSAGTRGTSFSNGAAFAIGNTGGSASFIADGGAHAFRYALYDGCNSSGNTLLITNAATVASVLRTFSCR